MNIIKRIFGFWYDFIVGDDWTAAAGVLIALSLSVVLVRAGLNPWWLLPLAVAISLSVSLWRVTRRT
jgi:hypothetical protein